MQELQQQVASLGSKLMDSRLSLSAVLSELEQSNEAAHAVVEQKTARKTFLLETANAELEKRAEEVTELKASVSELEQEAQAQAVRAETLSTELASAQNPSKGAPARNMLETLQRQQSEMDLVRQELSSARDEIEMLRDQPVSESDADAEAMAEAMAAVQAELTAAREAAAEAGLALELSQSTEAAAADAREQSEADTKQVELALGRLQAEESAAAKRHQRELKTLRREAEAAKVELEAEMAAAREEAQRKHAELEASLKQSQAHVEKLFDQVGTASLFPRQEVDPASVSSRDSVGSGGGGGSLSTHAIAKRAAKKAEAARPQSAPQSPDAAEDSHARTTVRPASPEPQPANVGELDFDQFRAAMRKAVGKDDVEDEAEESHVVTQLKKKAAKVKTRTI